uniref:Putative secreted protein n=1 Tax=Ixodes ricinus TaxID=34613 RepID=A0A147BNP6_IXORI
MASFVAASVGSASCSSASHLPNDDDDALLVDQMGLVLPEPLVGDGGLPLVLANAQPRVLSLNRELVVLSVGMSTVGAPSTIEDIPPVAPLLAARPAVQL